MQLGGRIRGDRWTCDGLASEPPPHAGFALEIPRNGVDVQVDFPHRFATIRHAGLRTRVWAPHDGDTVAVGWRDGLPGASRPHVDGLDEGAWIGGLRGGAGPGGWLDDRASRLAVLIADAGIDWLVVADSIAGVGWESHVADPDRLRRACDIVEQLARPRSTEGGPYR